MKVRSTKTSIIGCPGGSVAATVVLASVRVGIGAIFPTDVLDVKGPPFACGHMNRSRNVSLTMSAICRLASSALVTGSLDLNVNKVDRPICHGFRATNIIDKIKTCRVVDGYCNPFGAALTLVEISRRCLINQKYHSTSMEID